MIQEILSNVSLWLSVHGIIAYGASFLWGIASVLLSPCAMASLPLVVAYVAGQPDLVEGKKAFKYSLAFSGGLFLTLIVVAGICSSLGRLMGDVGIGVQLFIGFFLFWVGMKVFAQKTCSIPFPMLHKINIQGTTGAFLMGASYGVVAGPCTFGFVAPLLAIITVSKDVLKGLLMIVLFSVGHCLPLVMAGTFVAKLKTYLQSQTVFKASMIFQKFAGIVICALGVYFAINPFWGS